MQPSIMWLILRKQKGETEEENSSRTISLIDDFMEDGGFKLPKIDVSADYQPEYKPELDDNNKEEQAENSGVFTETLARIYIKQGKYQRALDIIRRLHEKHPKARACIMLTGCDSWKN